jgi:hypothetical protein
MQEGRLMHEFENGFTKSSYFHDKIETILPDGSNAIASIDYDEVSGPPWEESDGHGVVSEWRNLTRYPKHPWERILCQDNRFNARLYDVRESEAKALSERWDAAPYHDAFTDETAKQQAVRAVDADFKFLKDWCDDKWSYGMVVLKIIKPDGFSKIVGSVGGLEVSFYDEYGDGAELTGAANDLLDEYLAE